jgi:hypothetical protein
MFPLKYQSIEEFLSTYGEHFSMHSKEEQMKLFYTANWMVTFFNWVPAKKNKGLILQVIPRLVEGSIVKYITGSGQTAATKDRVFLYESEGNVKPFNRGRERKEPGSFRAPSLLEQSALKLASSQSLWAKTRKQRRRREGGKTASSTDLDGMTSDEDSSNPDHTSKKRKVFSLSAPTAALLNKTKPSTTISRVNSLAAFNVEEYDFALMDLKPDTMKRNFSWGADLVGQDSYLAYQEKMKDNIPAFPQLHHIPSQALLFPGELIGTNVLEDDYVLSVLGD